jgi:peptidoglycan/xylan/chitin deacetylase (PgdA/CDA1 family)
VGGGFFIWILRRWIVALRRPEPLTRRVRETGFLVLLIGVILFLTTHLLPCFSLFHPILCRAEGSEKILALSFDDGPNEPYTSQILDILKQEGIPATFFLVGENVSRYPEVVRRIQAEGHQIGNHSFTHTPVIFMSPDEIRDEIQKWESTLPVALNSDGKIFRAPRGWKSPFLNQVLADKGYRLIGWTRGVWDTDQPGSEVLFQRLTQDIGPGEIILLHDGGNNLAGVDRSDLVAVLPRVLQHYRAQGFRFVKISDIN